MRIDLSSLDLGTVPEWITAISTFLAFIAAGVAAWFALQQMKATRTQVVGLEEEAEERRKTKRREQAAQVSAWLTKAPSGKFLVLIFNASHQPVYSAVLTFIAPNNNNDMIVGTIAPMSSQTPHKGMSDFINVASETAKSIDLSWDLPNQNGTIKTLETQADGSEAWVEGQWRAGPIGIGITFTDTNGIRWERTIDGRMEEKDAGFRVSSSYVL